jgi:N utilization substance protein B
MRNRDKTEAMKHSILMMYQLDVSGTLPSEVLSTYWESYDEENEEVRKLAEEIFKSTCLHLKDIDSAISRYLKKGWPISRLLPMDRSILRVATERILYDKQTPCGAVINDAVNIAKLFGEGERSPQLINAVLDRIAKR